MKNSKLLFWLVLTVVIIWVAKFVFHFPQTNINLINITLTVASIIFGVLSGFFISQLWSRYTEVRQLQGDRTAATLTLLRYADNFYRNKRFKDDLHKRIERCALIDQMIDWDEGHIELPYFLDLERPLRHLSIRNDFEQQYLQAMLIAYRDLNTAMIRMNVLYKERLFKTEWLILLVLSFLIGVSVLFLNASDLFYIIVIFIFPPIIVLSLSIIHDLDHMTWEREMVTIEPSQIALDAIGAKRFYMTRDLPYVENLEKGYRTEKNLSGEMKKIYQNLIAGRIK